MCGAYGLAILRPAVRLGAEAHAMRGAVFVRTSGAAETVRAFESAVGACPGHAAVRMGLTAACMKHGMHEDAAASFGEAARLDPAAPMPASGEATRWPRPDAPPRHLRRTARSPACRQLGRLENRY